jgi:DNA-binding transcriptional regulator LsrR (DeoR family)
MARTQNNDFNHLREIYRVLVLHFLEGKTQAEIAKIVGVTPVKINRLIKDGRKRGMLQILVRSPFESVFETEQRIREISGLADIKISPSVSDREETIAAGVGDAAARMLLDRIKDGQTIGITGGKGMQALVENLNPDRTYDVEVVPVTGCVQGMHYTDVNHVATQLAEKLGGKAWQIHAPLFAETPEQRDVLMSMRQVKEILDKASRADIAIVGAGSIQSDDSSYYDLHPLSALDKREIHQLDARAELLAHLVDDDGQPINWRMNNQTVGLTPDQLMKIPFRFCVAWGEAKVGPIRSIVRGQRLNGLVTDEVTAMRVLDALETQPELKAS